MNDKPTSREAGLDYLRDRVRMGQQKDDPDMANEAQARLTQIEADKEKL